MDSLRSALATLVAGKDLSTSESHSAFASLLDGEVPEVVAAAFLTALKMKGETSFELEGAVTAVRERMTGWDSGMDPGTLVDTCGTGGDGAGTVNISTAAAIVVAACGVPVVKHGNRAATGLAGSSDVLGVLGVATNLEPRESRRCLAELRIAFLFAPAFHPGLVRLAPVRRQLPFRTIFNLVGPLCNPASPCCQLVGVPDTAQAELVAQVLCRQPHIRRAAVVTGRDGLDEVTLGGPTQVWIVEEGSIRGETWHPEDFGLNRHDPSAITIRDVAESADKLMRAFAGEQGPVRDYILANSAAALWVARQIPLRESTALAAAAIDSGTAAGLLERWRQFATPADRSSRPGPIGP
jgi:anthranilate phosphoribosyltransferase